ncbi:uroporphyrinogen-III C-methyltransferase [Legionella yabuuchiae]|uniref:uroporphyrinogen-III C-methyltransferase n=1 Tax=Legionella yabuuchiae TaxID=376727 RepID=UPI001056ACC9|nr:uroporphyrinogen-III C-methyltransferase [Legionella yabuuchiae]
MGTSEKTNTTESATAKSMNKSDQSASSRNYPIAQRPTFIAFILVIALIAMAFALFATYTNIRLQRQMATTTDQMTTELSSISETHSSVQQKIDNTIESFTESSDQLAAKLNALDKHMQSALKQQLYHSDDWIMLNARYYLQLAQINAHWSNNSQTTLALLQQADELLATIHDPRLFEVRQAIAQEINQIKTLQTVDYTGLLSKLEALQEAVSALPVKKTVTPDLEHGEKPSEHKTPEAWRERLKNSVNLLERLVVIRRHDEEIQPLLSQQQESLLRASIRLNLQEAQWAVLQNNEIVYKMALNQTAETIKRYFAADSAVAKGVLKQLQALNKKDITVSKLDLKRSLTLLNQLIQAKNSKSVEAPKTGDRS